MKKVNLSMKEEKTYQIIKNLVDNGITPKTKKIASIKLEYSLRHVDRLIKKYIQEGKQGFSHKNKGKTPVNKISDEIRQKVIDIYLKEYLDANIIHFCEIVNEDLKTNISNESIRSWLIEEKILSPKAHKKTKKKIKKLLKEELKLSKSKKKSNQIKEKIEELDVKNIHPRRQRCKYAGEMIQMDASEYCWIDGKKWTLHLAIDDASGRVVGAYFDYQETLYGYYQVFKQILINYGIPNMFYTDRRTVFEYKRKSRAFDDEDTFTQFSYACHKLGVEIKTTSVPEAKGRIERLNQTFQSRLPVELRRADIVSIEDANIFLISYLQKYNDQFALQLNNTKNVFAEVTKDVDINNILSVLSIRVIDSGHTIHYKNKIYTPAKKTGKRIYLSKDINVVMIETLDGRLMINVLDELYYAKEVKSHEDISKEFDYIESKELEEYSWKLPRTKDWRTDDFLGYLSKQKHRKDMRSNLC
ncbi:MAG: ISNCY family transposase [Bacilli bacterium]|nr:ISNCY family transposase [Bacilli bacterium]